MPVGPMPVGPIVPHVIERGYRWLKQYRAGGLQEMLKIRQATGRSRVIFSAVRAGISQKLSEESCDFKSYK
jgi:putative transposase